MSTPNPIVDENIRKIETGIEKLKSSIERAHQSQYFGEIALRFNLQDGKITHGKVAYDESFK